MCDSQETVTLGEELHTAPAGRGVHVVLEAVALGLSAGGVVGEVLTLPAWPGRLLFIIRMITTIIIIILTCSKHWARGGQ